MTGNNNDWGDQPYQTAQLITKFLQDDISDAEMEQLHSLLDADTREKILETFRNTPAFTARLAFMQRLDKKEAWKKVLQKQKGARRHTWRRRLSYAAMVTVILAATLYWQRTVKKDDRIVADHTYGYKNDVLPGTAQAELILSNGKKVMLQKDSVELEEEDGTRLRSHMGILQYAAGDEPPGTGHLYNTLRVPEAGTFFLKLPDGTSVWLNAESELTFPVRFNDNERTVVLKGEGYFEVAKDAVRPFKVSVNDNEIQVLGTTFNISAYGTVTTTTLLSGRVAVAAAGKKALLQPGQQALSRGGSLYTAPADVEKAIAWRKGYFYFSQDPVTVIMDQLSRWYGVTIKYEGNIPMSVKYGGTIDRNAKLGEVLEQLKSISGLHFYIDGKILTVSDRAIKN